MSIGTRLYVGGLRVHQAVYELTDGLLGHRLLGLPTLLLRTTGRRSGKTRTNALVYARDGDRCLIVPSNGGAPKAPAWHLNLKANPEVEIQIGRERMPARAEVIGQDHPDFARLWQIADENNSGRYSSYQRKTTRQIPVVALTPRSP